MQRLHLDDLAGHVMENENWDEICLPAIAEEDEVFTIGDGWDVGRKKGEALHPERESLEMLENVRKKYGSFMFQAQYQQCPVPEAGNPVRCREGLYYDWTSWSNRAVL